MFIVIGVERITDGVACEDVSAKGIVQGGDAAGDGDDAVIEEESAAVEKGAAVGGATTLGMVPQASLDIHSNTCLDLVSSR